MTDRVRIAVQKNGRLSDESTKLLKKCGISFNKSSDKLFLLKNCGVICPKGTLPNFQIPLPNCGFG